MNIRTLLASAACLATLGGGALAQQKIDMKLAGQMRIFKGGTLVSLKLEATGSHAFPERVLAVGSAGAVEKTARVYETARAVITVADDRTERTLRPGRPVMMRVSMPPAKP